MRRNDMGNGIAYATKRAPDMRQELIRQSLPITDDLKQTDSRKLGEIVLKLKTVSF